VIFKDRAITISFLIEYSDFQYQFFNCWKFRNFNLPSILYLLYHIKKLVDNLPTSFQLCV